MTALFKETKSESINPFRIYDATDRQLIKTLQNPVSFELDEIFAIPTGIYYFFKSKTLLLSSKDLFVVIALVTTLWDWSKEVR